MTAEELTEFAASVAGVTAKIWGGAAGAAAADLSGLWAAGAAQGWFGLGQDDALDAVLAALRELGRAACPLPLMDAFVAVRLLGAEEKTAAQIASGELRVLVAPDEGTGMTRYLDGGAAATHVLTLPAAGGTAALRPVTGRRELARAGRAALDHGRAGAGAGAAAAFRGGNRRRAGPAAARPRRPRPRGSRTVP